MITYKKEAVFGLFFIDSENGNATDWRYSVDIHQP